MAVRIRMAAKGIEQILKNQRSALYEATTAMMADLSGAKTIPLETGVLAGAATALFFYADEGRAEVVSDTPYAARLYFHPEYHFRQDGHQNAGAHWFEPYISGEKKAFIAARYGTVLKKMNLGGGGQ